MLSALSFLIVETAAWNGSRSVSVCNQMSDPSPLWPINLVPLRRISREQNTVGWYPVDVLFLLACGELLFVSTIYYLYTYLYCDMLPGQPFCTKRSCSHVRWEGKHISTAVAKSVHTCIHTHTHTHTQTSHKNAHLPLSIAPLLQSRQHKLDSGTLTGKISPPLCTYCIHLLLCLSILYSWFFFPCFSQSFIHNFLPAMSGQGHFILVNFFQAKHTRGVSQHVLVVAKLPGCPYKNLVQSPNCANKREWVSFIAHWREYCVYWLTDGVTVIMCWFSK